MAAIRLTTAATTDPVTLTEAKLHLRVDDDADDTYIVALIKAATAKVQTDTARQLINATWTWTLDAFPRVMRLLYPPAVSVTSVKYYDSAGVQQTLVAGTDYQVDVLSQPGRIQPAYTKTWPDVRSQLNVVEVIYVAGYGTAASDVPMELRQGIKLWIAQMYEFREPTITGAVVSEVGRTVDALIGPYCMAGVG